MRLRIVNQRFKGFGMGIDIGRGTRYDPRYASWMAVVAISSRGWTARTVQISSG